jgi:hypothetical protein
LQQLKPRNAVFVERHYLAIQYHVCSANAFSDSRELGILGGHLYLVARNETSVSILDETDCPDTVPFGFKQPRWVGEGFVDERRKHRFD